MGEVFKGELKTAVLSVRHLKNRYRKFGTYTQRILFSLKNNEILSFVTTWMELEIIK
jgi:hypothetical protein